MAPQYLVLMHTCEMGLQLKQNHLETQEHLVACLSNLMAMNSLSLSPLNFSIHLLVVVASHIEIVLEDLTELMYLNKDH